MVVVEFFSDIPIDNMISTLTGCPDKVILVGQSKIIKRSGQNYKKFLASIGNDRTEIDYCSIIPHNLGNIVKALEKIVMEYSECHFDLTGGDELAMAAIGIIYERFGGKGIKLHQYNIKTGAVYDCDMDGRVFSSEIPSLTVEQNIILHGGSIVTDAQRSGSTYSWNFTESFEKDVFAMWEICRKNCALWNYQVTMLSEIMTFNSAADDELQLCANMADVEVYLRTKGNSLNLDGIFDKLVEAGMLVGFGMDDEMLQFRFKDKQVKMCLTKAGTLLELVTLLSARRITKEDGKPYFTDARTGVMIDWDGIVHNNKDGNVDTENEIDVILMKGVVPIFISCKNGKIPDDELYKLNTVAEQFGSGYAKKVLVAADMGKKANSRKYFLERAKDMGIQIIENVHTMSPEKFENILKNI